jgi:hypothetical protein
MVFGEVGARFVIGVDWRGATGDEQAGKGKQEASPGYQTWSRELGFCSFVENFVEI